MTNRCNLAEKLFKLCSELPKESLYRIMTTHEVRCRYPDQACDCDPDVALVPVTSLTAKGPIVVVADGRARALLWGRAATDSPTTEETHHDN
jgi:hypothetical protein